MRYRWTDTLLTGRAMLGSTRWPAMKHLFAVRNVAAHAEEMEEPAPANPVFFQKPASCFQDPPELALPEDIGPIEFEVELAVRVGAPLSRASSDQAAVAIEAVGVVLDLTARELQAQRKQAGLPWFEAKGFDGAGVMGPMIPADTVDDLPGRVIRLAVGGTERQRFTVGSYAVSPADLLARCSRWVSLEPGDILGCGTGAGVGRIHVGDDLVAEIAGLEATRIEATVTAGPERL